MRDAWEDFWDVPGILTWLFMAAWFGMGILVGVAVS